MFGTKNYLDQTFIWQKKFWTKITFHQNLFWPKTETKPTKPNVPKQPYQTNPTKSNLPNQTKPNHTIPNLPKQPYQNNPTKPNLLNQTKPHQTYHTKPTIPNILNQTKYTKPNCTYQKRTFQSNKNHSTKIKFRTQIGKSKQYQSIIVITILIKAKQV